MNEYKTLTNHTHTRGNKYVEDYWKGKESLPSTLTTPEVVIPLKQIRATPQQKLGS